MARKPNYDYEKRRKQQDRKAKKDAKRADRQQRREDRAQGLVVPEDGAPPEDEGQTEAVPPED